MNILSHPRSLAFGLVLLAAAFGFGGSLACAQAIEPSFALADGNANLAMRPDALFCVTYYGADETCFSEAALVAEETESSAVDEVAPVVAELAPSATETDSLSLYGAEAIKVAITESVTIAAPGQEVENSEPESTGSLPSDAATGEPNSAPDVATPARDMDALFCVTYYGADETCFSEAALVAEETESSAVDEVASVVAELAPSATETDSLSLYGADAIKVAITESVTIAAPGQEVENSEPESTGSLPSDAATGEPNSAPDVATPARDGTD